MKALLIGGTGPTGPLLVKGLLDRKYKVTILHTGKHEVKLPDSVEHLHGNVHLLESLREVLGNRTYDIIIGMYGRLRYVAEAIKGRTTRFISIGGAPYRAFVEGDKFPGGVPLFLNEEEPLFRDEKKNRFTYLMTISEELVMEAHQEGFYNATILRFPMIYGPRQVAPREWCIIRRVLDGRKQIIVPDGGLKLERRGYAENVAHSVLLTVDNPEQSAGEIFNVGEETILSLKEWIKVIANILNHEFEFVSMPFEMARPSRPYAGRNFHWVTNIEKIKEKVGYRDIVSARDGLRKTIDYYLKNPLESGGILEQQLKDPFDYNSEDLFIKNIREMETGMRKIDWVGYKFEHAYEHPKD